MRGRSQCAAALRCASSISAGPGGVIGQCREARPRDEASLPGGMSDSIYGSQAIEEALQRSKGGEGTGKGVGKGVSG